MMKESVFQHWHQIANVIKLLPYVTNTVFVLGKIFAGQSNIYK